MRVRSHILLIFGALFACVGVTSGALLYSFARAQIIWGAEQEAQAAAVALAAQIEHYFDGSASTQPATGAILKVFRSSIVKQAYLVPIDSSQPTYRLSQDGTLLTSPQIAIPSELFQDNQVVSQQLNQNVMRAWAPIRIVLNGKPHLLAVETATGYIQPKVAQLEQQIIFGTVAVCVIAILLALLLAAMITRQLRRLTALTDLDSPAIDVSDDKRCAILEVNNLNDSLRAMRALACHVINQARPASEAASNFDTTSLAECFNRLYLQPINMRLSCDQQPTALHLQLADQGSNNDFFELIECEDHIYVYLGALACDQCCDNLRRRSALLTLIRQMATRGSSAQIVLKTAQLLFEGIEARCVIIPKRPSGACTISSVCLAGKREIAEESHFVSDANLLIQTLDHRIAALATKYAGVVKNSSPHELVSELMPILRPYSSGVLLSIGVEQ